MKPTLEIMSGSHSKSSMPLYSLPKDHPPGEVVPVKPFEPLEWPTQKPTHPDPNPKK
jgi:hypothetical protein